MTTMTPRMARAHRVALPAVWTAGPMTAIAAASADRVAALRYVAVPAGVVLVLASAVVTVLAVLLRADFADIPRTRLRGMRPWQAAWYELLLGGYTDTARRVLAAGRTSA